ncbi:MAG TPA: rhombosortase [Candidatus Limnocylindria bacterium]|nr:rhombosortase [Candidatus Limnocylindria bacterium]
MNIAIPLTGIKKSSVRSSPLRVELIVFAILLAIANAPLLSREWNEQLVFFPDRVANGEWWRIVTHPFVHVSWYHLLLDGAAFLMLFAELRHWSPFARLNAVGASAFGSLAAALTSPAVSSIGFCGLSGVAHGLMAITAIEMIRRAGAWEQRAGWCSLAVVLGKAALEAATGNVVLASLHFGLMGVPIAVCHAGGVIGGLVMYGLRSARDPRSVTSPAPQPPTTFRA